MKKVDDIFKRSWIIKNSIEILGGYSSGITVRQLYYRLVSLGMFNTIQHYKRVVSAMTKVRWSGEVSMTAFIDRERAMYGETSSRDIELEDEIITGKHQVESWMKAYHLDRWSNQENYVEVWIEKKALQGVFEDPCDMFDVGLAPCKGYSSITFLYEANGRFFDNRDKNLVILYFGDYDPSGLNIPESIEENLMKMGSEVTIDRIALNSEQIKSMGLPGAPPKVGDSRSANWNGDDVVECDAVEPRRLARMCKDAISKYFDEDLYDELKEKEEKERGQYQDALKKYVKEMEI